MPSNGRTTTRTTFRPIPTPAPCRPRRALLAVAGTLAITATMAACGVGSAPRGDLAENKKVLAACDASAPPAADVQLDGSGSSASKAITEERMAAIESIVRTTAICSGRLRVSVFSASSAATTTLFDEPLHLHGATDNARLKRVSRVVDDAMAQIRKAYEPAITDLPGGGSDITAQYRLAGEWADQVGGDHRLHLTLFTDGFQTARVNLYKKALTKQEATALAGRTTVPKLPGASVTVAGLGRVASSPPSSSVVEGLTSYYNALCKKTGAAKCVSVTSYVAEGR